MNHEEVLNFKPIPPKDLPLCQDESEPLAAPKAHPGHLLMPKCVWILFPVVMALYY